MTTRTNRYLELIEKRSATVGVVGLGYVGLPLILAFADAGFSVLGFDVDSAKIAQLEQGKSYIRHIPSTNIQQHLDTGRLAVTDDLARLGEPDAILICVPTPLDDKNRPDLSYVLSTVQSVRQVLCPGQLIVLESTTYPGTTTEILQPALEESGLVCGTDFFLAYSPEREDPGNPNFDTRSIPKVVGGADAQSQRLAETLYAQVVERVIPVSSPAAAEASKLTENIFRAVNIALVNELKMVFDGLGVDVWEVLDAAETKPFGFMRFNPGPGWGGHCIPIDPFYLSWKARQVGREARFIELAGEINTLMPEYVIDKLTQALESQGKNLGDCRILLLGLAYKKDVADPRESPAFELLARLQKAGVSVDYHDPYIPATPSMRSWSGLPTLQSVALNADTIAAYDAVVVVTDHSAVDYRQVLEHANLIVDTRGVYRDATAKVIRA